MYRKTPTKRYNYTLQFLQQFISTEENILDLGVSNPFSDILKENGYSVTNTNGEDLDVDTSAVQKERYDVVTAFEIFEHLVFSI